MRRILGILVACLVALATATSPAVARPPDHKLADLLGQAWTAVLETPAGVGDQCYELGKRVVAPLTLSTELTCVVRPGTKVFVTAWSSECSTAEAPPFFGRDEAELRACAVEADEDISVTVRLDGRELRLAEVVTGLVDLDLPPGNVLGVPPGSAQSVAHGWVALLHPLPPGEHTIVIEVDGTYFDDEIDFTNTTTIVVEPRGGGRNR